MNFSPLQLVRDYYQSLEPGRRQELMEILDPHLVIEVPQCLPGAGGTYCGLKAYIEDFLFGLYGTYDCQFPVDEYLDAGDTIVVLGRQQGRAISTGAEIDVPFVHLWTVSHGKLVRGRMFTDTAALCRAVGAPIPNPASTR